MTETAAMQLRRVLLLLPQLADGEPHSLEELAGRLGTDRDQLVEDVAAISARGDLPGGFVEGVQIFLDGRAVALRSNTFLRPMRLTAAELSALALGLGMLSAERAPEERATLSGARHKLASLMTALPADVIAADFREAALGAHADATHLAALRGALQFRRKVAIAYRRGDDEEVRSRVVRPYALIVTNGAWYLVAHCESSDGVRVFRLDRVSAVTTQEAAYEVPATFSLEDVLTGRRVFHADASASLRVRYSPQIARWISERTGVPVDPDGSLTLDHPLADEAWAVRHVLQYGPDAEVLAPASVREAIARRLDAVLAGGG